jgi:PadR family transcriptional regulator PadR
MAARQHPCNLTAGPSLGLRGELRRVLASEKLYCGPEHRTLPWYGNPIGTVMADKLEVKQGTLALMILKTLEVLGSLHGYGIARRIEETSSNRLTLNYGTLYPALLKLEQEGFIKAEWKQSENNRRAKYYALTASGRKQLARETREWYQTADLIAAFLSPNPETP